MKKEFWIAYAIVLGPALVCSLICFVAVCGTQISIAAKAMFADIYTVELAKELVAHAAFYGVAVGTFLGHQHDDVTNYVVATGWFALCVCLAYSLTRRIKLLKKDSSHD